MAAADGRAGRRTAAAGAWWRATFAYRPFLVLLGLGVALRLVTVIAYSPAILNSQDSPRFARAGGMPLFGDYWMPAGYPLFLKVLRALSDDLWVTIAVQHVLGLAMGALLFAGARWLGVRAAFACVPAAVVFLSGDVLFLEHIVMADVLMLLCTVLALLATARGLWPAVDVRWLAAGGALAMAAMLSRSTAVVVVGVVVVVALAFGGRGLRGRGVALLACAGAAVVMFAAYVGAYTVKDGQYLGITDMSGWNLVGRVEPFADCRRFTPPAGTRPLCDPRPPAARPGPFGYIWDENSISRRAFTPLGPATGDRMEPFFFAAVAAQPGDYADAVLTDLARYVDPAFAAPRPFSGQPADLVSFGYTDPATVEVVTRGLEEQYAAFTPHAGLARQLAAWQNLTRIDGWVLLLALVLTGAGMAVGRGGVRIGAWLFGLAAAGLWVLPTLTLSWDLRYGIPQQVLIAAGAAFGLEALVGARARARSAPPAAGADAG